MLFRSALAVRGLGIAELPHRFARDCVGQGRLVPVLPGWQLPSVAIWCVTAGRRLLPKRSEAFIEILRAVLADSESGVA